MAVMLSLTACFCAGLTTLTPNKNAIIALIPPVVIDKIVPSWPVRNAVICIAVSPQIPTIPSIHFGSIGSLPG